MDAAMAKKNAHRLIVDGINKGNMAVLEELLSPKLIEHNLPSGIPGNLEGFKMFITTFRAAFPDLTYAIEDEFADGDRVMHRLTGSGTMKGDLQGMKASNKKATWQEMHIARVDAEGKIVEHWATVDQLGMLSQLGFGPQM
jgi:predicted ester cyclase